jgi:hypothetical protein
MPLRVAHYYLCTEIVIAYAFRRNVASTDRQFRM